MAHLIDKDALVTEIDRLAEVKPIDELQPQVQNKIDWLSGKLFAINSLRVFLDTIEVKEVDIDKLCEFRKNIGFAYPEGASEYQKQLACYRQGIKDAIKAQKGE